MVGHVGSNLSDGHLDAVDVGIKSTDDARPVLFLNGENNSVTTCDLPTTRPLL